MPFTVGIGGAHSSCGKTTVAAALLKALTAGTRPSGSPRDTRAVREPGTHGAGQPAVLAPRVSLAALRRWGAIKWTKTPMYASIIDNGGILSEKGKDTARLLEAGAEEVLWVRSPTAEIGEVLPMAVERLCHLDGILVEGNSAIEFLSPDIVIFITGSAQKDAKPSARSIFKRADIIIVPEDSGPFSELSFRSGEQAPLHCTTPVLIQTGPLREGLGESLAHELLAAMEATLERDRIEQLLKERSAGGVIACRIARRIAEELNVPYDEVGKTANALKIKIRECELGCF